MTAGLRITPGFCRRAGPQSSESIAGLQGSLLPPRCLRCRCPDLWRLRALAGSLVRKHYDDDQIAALVSLVALINAANRLAVIVHQQGGSYEPGMFAVAFT